MIPCAKHDPTSIDVVQITGHRADGAIRGKAVLTLRQSFGPTSKNIADAVLAFAKLLSDKDPRALRRAGVTTTKTDRSHNVTDPHVTIDAQSVRQMTSDKRAERSPANSINMASPPMPSEDDLKAMLSSSDDEADGAEDDVRAPTSNAGGASFRTNPRCAPYARMIKMHMPETALRHKMRGAGFTDAEIEAFLADRPLARERRETNPTPPPPKTRPRPTKSKEKTAIAEFDFAGEPDDAEQLPVKAGETVTVLEKFDDGWWRARNAQGREGIVPADFMKEQ